MIGRRLASMGLGVLLTAGIAVVIVPWWALFGWLSFLITMAVRWILTGQDMWSMMREVTWKFDNVFTSFGAWNLYPFLLYGRLAQWSKQTPKRVKRKAAARKAKEDEEYQRMRELRPILNDLDREFPGATE